MDTEKNNIENSVIIPNRLDYGNLDVGNHNITNAVKCFVELFGMSKNLRNLSELLGVEIAVFANGEKSRYFLPTTQRNGKFTDAVKNAVGITIDDSLLVDFEGIGSYTAVIPIIFNQQHCGVVVAGFFSVAQKDYTAVEDGVRLDLGIIRRAVKIICGYGSQLMRRAAKYVGVEDGAIKNNPYYIQHQDGLGNFDDFLKNFYSNSFEYEFSTGFWHCSDIVADWLGISKGYPNTFAGMCNLIFKEDIHRANKFFVSIKNGLLENFSFELRIKRPCDEEIRWLELRGSVVTDTFGEPLKIVGMVNDISFYKETALRLEKQIETKNRLLSIIGHDLKNPFNSLLGFGELLSRSIAESRFDDAAEYVEIIKSSASQGYDLLVNIMDYSRCEMGRITMCVENLYLHRIVESIFNLSYASAFHKNVILSNQIAEDICISGDMNMISAVLRNLINNAIKFCNKDGVVRVSAEKNQTKTMVCVSDTGVMLSYSDIAKILNPDSRISTAGTFGEQGTGLGLWICKYFLQRHDSKLSIISSKLETIFSFDLPTCGVG